MRTHFCNGNHTLLALRCTHVQSYSTSTPVYSHGLLIPRFTTLLTHTRSLACYGSLHGKLPLPLPLPLLPLPVPVQVLPGCPNTHTTTTTTSSPRPTLLHTPVYTVQESCLLQESVTCIHNFPIGFLRDVLPSHGSFPWEVIKPTPVHEITFAIQGKWKRLLPRVGGPWERQGQLFTVDLN